MSASTSFLRALPSADKEELLKLTTVQELPKSRYATKLAVTAYPHTRRGRKTVLSHIEVFKMVENVAGKMREAGVRPGTVCAFSLPTNCESIIFFYACMWIAAVAAPIDPSLEDDDFEAAVRAVGAKLIVSPLSDDADDPLHRKCQSVASKLDLLEWNIHRTINEGVVLETHGRVTGSGAAWAGGASDFKLDPEEIAVHMASSVGVVPLSHYALCEAAKSFVTTYDLEVNMSTMLAPPLHDIHGILILIATFYSGGHIVLPGLVGFDAEKFWEFADTHRISWVSAAPDQILDLYEKKETSASKSKQQLTFVRSSGSTSITPEVLEKVESGLKTPVYQSYGTPEACGFATANTSKRSKAGTVGVPVHGIDIAVFDVETREECAIGTVGEIAVRGKHVASGYMDNEEATEDAMFFTEADEPDGEPAKWLATGDRGLMDDDGFFVVHGNSKVMRAAELEMKVKEEEDAENAAKLAAEEADRELQMKLEEEEAERQREEQERLEKENRRQEQLELELRSEKDRVEEETRRAEEEEEKRRAEEEAGVAAAMAAAAAAEAEARAAEEAEAQRAVEEEAEQVIEEERELDLDEQRKLMETRRSTALLAAGVENPDELDEETANAILARLENIEDNHRRLQEDVDGRNAKELEEMRRRVAEAEAEANLAARGVSGSGKIIGVRMEELEAAVLAAAASAESSANNTREAVKAAREVADAAYGTNQSQPVEVKASTGDQGALTKTVRVSLDEVEKAMQKHPAVETAKAFGRKDKRFGAEVFCAIVPMRGARVSEPWLKLHAQSELLAPMVPKKFYYMSNMPEGITRRELAESDLLRDLSEFPGYSEVKHVKGPQWKPKAKRRVGA